MNMDVDGPAPKASPSPDREPRRPAVAVIVGDSMAAGSAVPADARQPELVSGLVLAGPFARDPAASDMRRALLRVAMTRPWAAISCKAYLPKLYAGRRAADFGAYRDKVVASLRRPGYARAF